MHIESIKPQTIRRWQNELIRKGYKQTYLKTIHNQLSAIFNYAVRYYGLHTNPARDCGSMGSKNADTMQFWTVEEFNAFDNAISDKLPSHILFNLLFWTGMRSGEALALTLKDFDFVNNRIEINKNYARQNGQDIIMQPKTTKSKRTIDMPEFLSDMIQNYTSHIYGLKKNDRIFPYTKYYLQHEMIRGSSKAGVKKIRVHDLRHSHASLLINMNVSVLLISERLGHENIETTLQTYSHLYPTRMKDTMNELEKLHNKILTPN